MLTLSSLFFIIASIYSMVGFGGGSSYTALLASTGLVPFQQIPLLSLTCNLIVVTCSFIFAFRRNYLETNLILPLVIVSIPASYFSAQISISQNVFISLLAITLFASGIKLIFYKANSQYQLKKASLLQLSIIGLVLGILSGMVGIGGGIFLSPALFYLRLQKPRYIAASATVFIFCNSIAGILGHLKVSSSNYPSGAYFLFFSVLIGSLLGNLLSKYKLRQFHIAQITGLLIVFVSIKLISDYL